METVGLLDRWSEAHASRRSSGSDGNLSAGANLRKPIRISSGRCGSAGATHI